MAKNTPAFQFYPTDFLGGVVLLSDEACGVYMKILCALWVQGNLLPFCLQKLARAASTTPEVMHRVWPEIEDKFEIIEQSVTHARFTKMIELSEKRRNSGSKGGAKRKQNDKQNGKQKRSKLGSKTVSKSEANSRRMKYEERSMKNEDTKPEDWVFPDGWDREDVRDALDGWELMRVRIKKPVKSRVSASKIFKRFDSPEHLIAAAEECEANDWQGLKPEYGRNKSQQPINSGLSVGQQSLLGEL